MTTTPHLGVTLLEQSQAQKEVTLNEALQRIDAILNAGVIDKDLAAPPGSPAAGDLYIVASSPTGVWAGKAGQVAYYDQLWRFIVPQEGLILWVKDEDKQYCYNGTVWVAVAIGDMLASLYDPANIAQQVVGTSATQTLTNKTLTAPIMTTPTLGTPASGTLTNCTGLPVATGVSGLGTNVASFLATPSSANLAAALTDKTGSGVNVFATTPTLVTPNIGVATATSVNKVVITAPTTSATLTVADGGSLITTGANAITLASTSGVTYTMPSATDTLVGRVSTDTLTNKTLTAPVLTTPTLGTPASGTLTNCTGLPISTGITGTLGAANGGTGVANNAAATITSSGNFAYTRTLTGTTNVTFPTTGTLATVVGSETLTNKTLTAPKFANAGFIADANGNELMIFTTTASAVNEVTLANGATGVGPTLTASGETNVDLNFQVKGTGVYNFKATASGPTDMRWFEDTDNGTNYVSLIAPANVASNRVLTLPDATDTLVGKATTDTLTNKTLTSPTMTSPVLGAASATSLTFSSTSGIIGTTTNDSAAAASVGELLSSTLVSGSAVALTTLTAANVTSLALTAGDWDVWFESMFLGGSTTVLSWIECSISTTSATMNTTPGQYYGVGISVQGSTTIFNSGLNYPCATAGPVRISLASTTTYYAVVRASFATSTCSAFGILRARRVR